MCENNKISNSMEENKYFSTIFLELKYNLKNEKEISLITAVDCMNQ